MLTSYTLARTDRRALSSIMPSLVSILTICTSRPGARKDAAPPSPLHRAWRKITPSGERFECIYCCERKPSGRFVKTSVVPYGCSPHLVGKDSKVCRACIESSLSAQLDSKPLLDVGCPQCSIAWESGNIKALVHARDRRRYRQLDEMAQKRTFQPSEAELPDGLTMKDLLDRGARQCPWCRILFVKLGGCDSMLCECCVSRPRLHVGADTAI